MADYVEEDSRCFNDCFTLTLPGIMHGAHRLFPARRDFLWAATSGREGEPPDGARPDVRSAEEAELPRYDADAADCGGHSAADGDCANAAGVEAEEAGVRSPDPTCRK